MAMQIAQSHGLVALRIDQEPGPKGLSARARLTVGGAPVSEAMAPLQAFGFPTSGDRGGGYTPDQISRTTFRLPDGFEDLLSTTAQALAGQSTSSSNHPAPLWLHLGKTAAELAYSPIERLLRSHAALSQRPIARIPNYLRDPFERRGAAEIAICVTMPLAKGVRSSAEHVDSVLRALGAHRAGALTAHVFAAPDCVAFLRGQTFDNLHVQAHDPETFPFEDRVARRRDIGAQLDMVQNPWLRWMAHELRFRPVDAVHFICPGYFHGRDGALALAETPLRNVDQQWSRFVSAGELHAFLDAVGAPAVGLSAPDGGVWATGLRLLAFDLAWRRAGPIINNVLENGGAEQTAMAYATLFDWGSSTWFGQSDADLPETDLAFSIHPRLLPYYATDSDAALLEALHATAQGGSDDAGGVASTKVREQTAPVSSLGLTALSDDAGGDNAPDWARLARRQIGQRRASNTSLHHASTVSRIAQEGEDDALNFLEKLLADTPYDAPFGRDGEE